MISDKEKIIFHVDVNSAYLSWTAVKLLQYGENTEKLCGNKMVIFKCIVIVNNIEKVMEIKYDTEKCKWILFKI